MWVLSTSGSGEGVSNLLERLLRLFPISSQVKSEFWPLRKNLNYLLSPREKMKLENVENVIMEMTSIMKIATAHEGGWVLKD